MAACHLSLPDGTRLVVSQHALTRYHERICPAHDRTGAVTHLQRLAALLGEHAALPEWVSFGDITTWVALGPDIGLVVENGYVVTVLCRGGVSERDAHRRKRRRQGRRAFARMPGPGRQQRAEARRSRRERRAPGLDDVG